MHFLSKPILLGLSMMTRGNTPKGIKKKRTYINKFALNDFSI